MKIKNLSQVFVSQVSETPNNIAIICNGLSLSYSELDKISNAWARLLLSRGVTSNSKVALLIEKKIELFIGILSVLKTGAAYIPIDPDYPAERIEYIITNSQCDLIITTNELQTKFNPHETSIISTEIIKEILNLYSDLPLSEEEVEFDENHLCYIIYTSGTTGRPKGVAIEHHSAINYVECALQIYGISAEDRIYQGFSIAFDASIEEIWLAFASGATLVVGHSNAIHAGAGLIEFLNVHHISVFSTVPTLLSMLEGEIKSLRVLILGGEVCPADLIRRWWREDLKIFNTYGPTEATVIATYTECLPDQPITIGTPLPNYQVFILNDQMQEIPPGEIGELYIGGAGVARGYMNNIELTQKKFITDSQGRRLYRTGDLAAFNENQEVEYKGRADDQIKLRGYRVELAEIENVLSNFACIKSAAVTVKEITPGLPTLVAYFVTKDNTQVNEAELNAFLHASLPDYMVPNILENIEHMPLLPSGKVDKKSLPAPKVHHQIQPQIFTQPTTDLEAKITKVWEEYFKLDPISTSVDFFHDLGGHSLLAAKIVSALRQLPGLEHLSLLDMYENTTIIQLATKAQLNETKAANLKLLPEITEAEQKKNDWRQRLCGVGQAIGCYLQFSLASWQFLFIAFIMIAGMNTGSLFTLHSLGLLIITLMFLHPALFMITILAKWIIIGRIKPGTYKLWSFYYFRWWLVQQLVGIAPMNYLAGSPLMIWYYRLMGVKIGKNCFIASSFLNAFDLIKIGNDTSINADAFLVGYKVENNYLKIGAINIGNHCFIGSNTVLGLNTKLEDHAKLGDQSMISDDAVIPNGQYYVGSPAVACTLTFDSAPKVSQINRFQKLGIIFCHVCGLYTILFSYSLAFIPGILLIDYFYEWYDLTSALLITPISALLFILIYCFNILAIKKILIGTLKPGVYAINSFFYVKKWLVHHLILQSLDEIGSLYATLYAPFWLRLLGAKVGKRTEISTLTHVSPDLLTIDDESFIADGVNLGPPRAYAGFITIAPNHIGKRTFVGNTALIPNGMTLGDGCLIGCLSQPPLENKIIAEGTSWFGSPSVNLKNREVFEGFATKETYSPTKSLYYQRATIDFLRIFFPPFFTFLLIALQLIAFDLLMQMDTLIQIALIFPICSFVFILGIVMFVIGLKWILIRQYKPAIQPAWSMSVWLNELVTGLYDYVMVPLLLENFLGTPFYAIFLRWMGAKIGKNVYIGTEFFTEYDLLEIGNNVALNSACTIQTHLFEDRVMKMDNITIEDDCTVGTLAIVLYDTVMQKNSHLAKLSLLMKGETLPANSEWEGIPAQLRKVSGNKGREMGATEVVAKPANLDFILN